MLVSFIGLGAMGEGMASLILKAGYDLTVWNRTSSKAQKLVDAGAKLANSPGEAVKDADVVLSMMFDDKSAQEVTFGEKGIASTLKKGAIHICCSTVSTEQVTRFKEGHKERGQEYASATVLGRPEAAAAGQLYVMFGGSSEILEKVAPILDTFSQKVFNAGTDPIFSNIAKLNLNFMIMSTIEQMSEVFVVTEKAGMDPKVMYNIMIESFFSAPVYKNYGSLMVDQNYDNTGASIKIGVKDTQLFVDAGRELHVQQPYANIILDRFHSAIANGDGAKDFVISYERNRADAGLSGKSSK